MSTRSAHWLAAAGVLAAGAGLAAACTSVSAQAAVPAVIAEPSAATRAELARAVTDALGGVPVTLADDALTRSSLLTLERAEPRGAAGRPLGGRTLEAPEQFRLVLERGRCVLVRVLDGSRRELSVTSCRPE